MDINWSSFAFLIGNVIGAIIKSRPNTVAIFRDKLIPGWIFISMLAVQFVKGAFPDVPIEPPPAETGQMSTVLNLAWAIPAFFSPVLEALKQTAFAIFLHQLKKQAGKAV